MSENGDRANGLQAADLVAVEEYAAPPEVRETFAEISRTIRAPFVGLFWRVLARDPATLRAAWVAVAPNLRTHACEAAAFAIRQQALIAEAAELSSHQAFKGDLARAEIDFDLRTKIGNFNKLVCYALPKHLLAATMLLEALEGRPSGGGGTDRTEIPLGVVEGAVAVPPVDPATARGRAAELLPAIAAGHGHPVPEDYFRSLARLPDYLGAAWNALKPVVRDQEYDDRARLLVELTVEASATMPYPIRLPAGEVFGGDRARFAQLVRLFRDHLIADTLLDALIVDTLTDGPDRAPRLPFDL